VAEVDGRVVANSQIGRKGGYSNHVGGLGIGIRKGYRDIGIGTEMLKALITKAEEMGLKMLTLGVFSSNDRAMHVYNKVGFRETGRFPKEIYKDGRYIDHIIMAEEIQQMLDEGVDVATVASRYKANSEVTTVKLSELKDVFQQHLEKLEVGKSTPIIEDGGYYYIIRLLE